MNQSIIEKSKPHLTHYVVHDNHQAHFVNHPIKSNKSKYQMSNQKQVTK